VHRAAAAGEGVITMPNVISTIANPPRTVARVRIFNSSMSDNV
jgi:hypothetical protein